MESMSTAMSGAWALISRAACSPVSRGIATSSTHRSGRFARATSTASTPSQAAAHDAVVVGYEDPHHLAHRQRDDGSVALGRMDGQLAPREQRALAHAGQ